MDRSEVLEFLTDYANQLDFADDKEEHHNHLENLDELFGEGASQNALEIADKIRKVVDWIRNDTIDSPRDRAGGSI